MKTKQIEKADTSKRLPWRIQWRVSAAMAYLRWLRFSEIDIDDLRGPAELHDRCHNTPREPHTQTVLYAREVWKRPAKLMPFKNMMPHGIKWTMRTDGVVSVQIAADLSKPTKVVRLPTLE